MNIDTYNLLDKIVDITNVGDRLSLDRMMIHALNHVLNTEDVVIYQATQYRGAYYFSRSQLVYQDTENNEKHEYFSFCHIDPDSESDGLKECVAHKQVVQQTNENWVPLIANDNFIGVLNFSSDRELADCEPTLRGLVSIYCNLVILLNDAERDTLTGLFNRKTLDARLTELINQVSVNEFYESDDRREADQKGSYWLAILDIDHFKAINDKYGHTYGDEVLLLVSRIMETSFRREDLLFRYGGEEFVVVLDTLEATSAMDIFERFRQNVYEFEFPQINQVSISIGLARLESGVLPNLIVERADQALYYAKEHGRNQLAYYNDLLEQGLVQTSKPEDDIELF